LKEVIVMAAFVISILAANLSPDHAPPPPEPHRIAEAPHPPVQGPG